MDTISYTRYLLQIMHEAMKPMSEEWDMVRPGGLRLHDDIWFNAIREFRKLKMRRELPPKDSVLDNLIHLGLIDQNVKCSPQINQVLRYSAVLAGRLTTRQFFVEEQVSLASSCLGTK